MFHDLSLLTIIATSAAQTKSCMSVYFYASSTKINFSCIKQNELIKIMPCSSFAFAKGFIVLLPNSYIFDGEKRL